MDPNQTLDYSLEGAKWLGLGIGVGYSTLIFVGPLTSSVLSKKIESQEELDSIVVEESKRLGLEGVKGIYTDELVASMSYISKDGIPMVRVNNFFGCRRAVRHELYHLYKGHCKKKFQSKLSAKLYYFLIGEPQACLYQLTGIKL